MTRIISSRSKGEPSSGVPRFTWPLRKRPLMNQRTLPTKIVNDPSDGRTQSEFKNIIGGPGTASPGRGGVKGARRFFQRPQTPPGTGANQTRIRTPRSSRIVRR